MKSAVLDQNLKCEISDDLIPSVIAAEKGITLCDLTLDRIECLPSIEKGLPGCNIKDDLSNCLYMLDGLFKAIVKNQDEVQSKYF